MERILIACLGLALFLSCVEGRGSKLSRGAADVTIEKALIYDQHTLADTFPYKDGVRVFRFDKMRGRLFFLDSIQQTPSRWAILQNRRDEHGVAPTVKNSKTDEYNSVADTWGVERHQSVPLYLPGETVPERYGRDGSLVRLLGMNADSASWRLESYNAPGIWEVPAKYVKPIDEGTTFAKVVMVDRTNQDIATLEKADGKWLVRSMNPCTTGEHTPPQAYPTPVGMFVIQDKLEKMFYTEGSSSAIVGYAPWASRFTNGAYLHGVPVNDPNGAIVEFSPTLGTVPRSHECVRNASSHARFIYDWAPVEQSIVFVYD